MQVHFRSVDVDLQSNCSRAGKALTLPIDGTPPDVRQKHPRIAAVVLAAGMSTRMGAANKLVLEIDGRPIVRHAVANLINSDVEEVIVVTGYDPSAIATAISDLEPRLIHNPLYRTGMGSSIAVGVSSVGEAMDAVLICHGDMPHVRGDTINRVIAAFAGAASAGICIPVRDSRRGHPVLFSRRFFPYLRALTGDVGGRELLDAYAAIVLEVSVDDDGIHGDYDMIEDIIPRIVNNDS